MLHFGRDAASYQETSGNTPSAPAARKTGAQPDGEAGLTLPAFCTGQTALRHSSRGFALGSFSTTFRSCKTYT